MAVRELLIGLIKHEEHGPGAIGWQYWLLLFVFAGVAFRVYHAWSVHVDLPTVGIPPGILGPWKAAFAWVTQSETLLREGIRKYGPSNKSFKVSTPARYVVFITSPKILNEIKDEESTLSFVDASTERIQINYTLHKNLIEDPYHLEIIQKKMTQSLTTVLPEVVDEITMAFDENTSIGDDWKKISIYPLMLHCVSRATNRLFVGIPLCRNRDYLSRLVSFASTLSRAGQAIDMFPNILKPFVAWYVLDGGRAFQTILQDVGPLFVQRRAAIAADPQGKFPNDAVQWVLDCAPPGSKLTDLCRRILFLNFAAIHTSSITITHLLLDLAAAPSTVIPALRHEIETALTTHGGWTKPALTAMKGLDSALRESQRLNGVTIGTVSRKATQSCTLSDGTRLPKGTVVMAPASAIHHDPAKYGPNVDEFDAFRFSKMRETPGQETRHQAVAIGTEYLAFGYGRHACPGRFFAANEVKVLAGYIIRNYDFEVGGEKGKQRPENRYFGLSCLPDFEAILRMKRIEGGGGIVG